MSKKAQFETSRFSDTDELTARARSQTVPAPKPTPKVSVEPRVQSEARPRGYLSPTVEGLESVQENLREEVRGLVGHTDRLQFLFEEVVKSLHENTASSKALTSSCNSLATLVSQLSKDILILDARIDKQDKKIEEVNARLSDHEDRLAYLESLDAYARRQ